MNFKSLLAASVLSTLSLGQAQAADYVIDTAAVHASINFRIKHLGYSWLTGRFDQFSGGFAFDAEAPADSSVQVEIDTASVNSNNAERDIHLRSGDFLDVGKFPKASFTSTSMAVTGESAVVTGDLTLHGVTREITLNADFLGGGKDPWGGVRAGFTATTTLTLADFGMTYNLGPASATIEMQLNIEGVKK